MINETTKAILSNLKAGDLQDRIRRFRETDTRSLSYKDLLKKIDETFSVLMGDGKTTVSPFIINMREFGAGTRFFRIRKIEHDDRITPLRCLSVETDAWSPPSHLCKAGRLNKEGESILYTSAGNASVAVEEMRIVENELFCMFVYKAKTLVKVAMVGGRTDFEGYSEDEVLKIKIIQDFLHGEFTRDVAPGAEHLYRSSEGIAKTYYDLPPREAQDAWCYPSAVKRGAFNVGFREELAREKLQLLGVQIGHIEDAKRIQGMQVRAVADWQVERNEFLVYPHGTAEFERLFKVLDTKI